MTPSLNIPSKIEWDQLTIGNKRQVTARISLTAGDPIEMPSLVLARYGSSTAPIVLESVSKRELRDFTEEDADREGFVSLRAYKRFWCKREGLEHWSPYERCITYGFILFEPRNYTHGPTLKAMQNLAVNMFPHS